MSYTPREGSGWEEGGSQFADVRRWRTPLEEGVYLYVTVTEKNSLFVLGRVKGENQHSVPMPEDIARVERDFGVHGWSIVGVFPTVNPYATGQSLMMKAVKP